MPETFSREVTLLRTVAQNLTSRPLPSGPITQELLRAEKLGRVGRQGDRLVAILRPGYEAFRSLSESVIERIPGLERGTRFAAFETALFDFLAATHLGRDASTIGTADAVALVDHISTWFGKLAKPRRVFVPCVISPWAAPRFSIGPVTFIFIDDATQSEFYPHRDPEDILSRDGFDRMLQLMRETHANWLACVSVEGCEHRRAEEIGALAVDLSIVALQLAAPALHTRSMCRLDARRGSSERRTLSEADGYYNAGWSKTEPGLAIGTGTLAHILRETQPLITAVGSCVRSFATGHFRLPNLERSWCDAAYWLHEGLAEPIDSIAVAKLETALEVLMVAESTAGSKRRMLQILECFYGLKPGDALFEGAETTAEQFAYDVARDRSRVLHGTWSTLTARLALNREGIENFVIPVIRRAALELDDYTRTSDPDDSIDGFLTWLTHKAAANAA